jgi:hypothetical protein
VGFGDGRLGQAGGHLEALEKDSSAAGSDEPGGEGLDDLMDGGLDTFWVEAVRNLETKLVGGGGTLSAGVEVTEGATAHGRRLAV